MTELLYYRNPEMLEFTAVVVSVETGKKGAGIVLNRTAFYPEGGGQPADRGTINGIKVVDVRKQEGEVTHYLAPAAASELPGPGAEVSCRVDFEHRFDYMQQHTGQHIISAALARTAGIGTVSVHQGEEYTAIETDAGEISRQQLRGVEDEANRSIRAGVEIEALKTDVEGLKQFTLRRPSKHTTDIRLINIPGIDCVACGGMHLGNTAETGLIKYTHQEKLRGHIRTFWKIGRRAYDDYDEKTVIINSLNELHSARQFELVEKSEAAVRNFNDLKYSFGKLEEEHAALFASKLAADAGEILVHVFNGRSKSFITALLKTLSSGGFDGPSYIFNRNGDTLTWAVTAPVESDFDFNTFRDQHLPLIDGRGGGRAPFWQGAAKNPDGLEKIIKSLPGHQAGNSLL